MITVTTKLACDKCGVEKVTSETRVKGAERGSMLQAVSAPWAILTRHFEEAVSTMFFCPECRKPLDAFANAAAEEKKAREAQEAMQ